MSAVKENKDMSDTPRTDAAIVVKVDSPQGDGNGWLETSEFVPVSVSRQIERELNEAKANTYTALGYQELIKDRARLEFLLNDASDDICWPCTRFGVDQLMKENRQA